MPTCTNLVLMAKRPNANDWMTRSRLGDINYRLRDGKITLEEALEKSIAIRVGWMAVEPLTEFRVSILPTN